MEQSQIIDFLKEIAAGFKRAKSYPPGHPVMDKVVDNTMAQLVRIYNEIPTFSMYFLEQTVIFQDLRIDVSKNAAVRSLLDAFRKTGVSSLTFEPRVSAEDIQNLYEVISSSRLKIKEYGDATTMLVTRGTQKIKINAIKFGVQRGAVVQVAQEARVSKDPGEIVKELKNLKVLFEKGVPGVEGGVTGDEKGVIGIGKGGKDFEKGGLDLETKTTFKKIITDLNSTPKKSWRPYSEAVARIIENLPAEQRIELFKEVELKPFVLRLFSSLSDNTLTQLILNKIEDKNQSDVKRIVTAIGTDKIAKVAPDLEKKNPHIYEYLEELGVVLGELSEKMAGAVSKDDLRASLKSYYIMLDSKDASVRVEGLRAIIMLASRFVKQKNFELADEIIVRISTALGQESVNEVISGLIDHLSGLYKRCREARQETFCTMILEPFSKILGRGDLPIPFKSKIVKFYGATGNPAVLSVLFSFLWDSGIYPDVRSAILKFGKDAVGEALLTLKEAEDRSLSTKLADILKNIGKESIDILMDNLDDAEWYLRRNIITILGEIGDKSVGNRLLDFLNDEDDRVRLAVVQAFAKLEYKKGLFKALNDASVEIKAEALRGLRPRISTGKVKELFSLFKTRGDQIHVELLKIIGEKKITEAVVPVVEFIKSLEYREDTAAQELKETAITALVKANVWNIKTILEEFTRSNDKILSQLSKKTLEKIA